ncbi:MAG: hypothetical protein F6J97_00955 [Leptolyngbya sp. SIO4C1]|nr:hypothetical protein [Leptolyngbya sp. SIO4C1]
MEISRINCLENFDIDSEWDSVHEEALRDEEIRELEEKCRLEKIILCGSNEAGNIEGVSYLWVDIDYSLEMSAGQQELYRLLRDIQKSTVYTVTTISKLMEALKLECSFSVLNRLEHLQSIGAISGFK